MDRYTRLVELQQSLYNKSDALSVLVDEIIAENAKQGISVLRANSLGTFAGTVFEDDQVAALRDELDPLADDMMRFALDNFSDMPTVESLQEIRDALNTGGVQVDITTLEGLESIPEAFVVPALVLTVISKRCLIIASRVPSFDEFSEKFKSVVFS